MMTVETSQEIATIAEAYVAGKDSAEKMMVVGEIFRGSMPIADLIGERGTLTWDAAHIGARLVISKYKDIYTDQITGRITQLI